MTAIDESDAIAAARQHVDCGGRAVAFNDGVNTVFGLPGTDGAPEYVVKFGTYDPEGVRTEPHVLRLIEPTAPVPTVRGAGEVDGVPYFVTDHLSGEQPPYPTEMDAARLEQLARDIGRALAQIQSHSVDGAGLIRHSEGQLRGEDEDWPTAFRSTVERFAEDAKKNYPGVAGDVVRLLHWASVPDLSRRAVPTPLDLHTHNVFVTSETGGVSGVVDLERCYAGHPGWAFATTRHILDPDGDAAGVRDAFAAGYEEWAGFTPLECPAFELAAVVREMRAAHMWWGEPDAHKPRLRRLVDRVEDDLSAAE